MGETSIVVIGAGMAGNEAALLAAYGGRRVYIVEKASLIGGLTVKYEDVFPGMECSTCMIAPKQQELLQHPDIELMTLSEVEEVRGEAGDFTVSVLQKARYVDEAACIACGECYEPCPVALDNPFEEDLSRKKAIYVACPGALPNVPAIDAEHCLRFTKGEDCTACRDACVFEAIDYAQEDRKVEIKAGAIVVATGAATFDVSRLPQYGYGKHPGVYTAMEFERLYAANGPTEGAITLRDGGTPKSAAIVHGAGAEETGYASEVNTMYAIKFSTYLKHKFPEIEIRHYYGELRLTGKLGDTFYKNALGEGAAFVGCEGVEVGEDGGNIEVKPLKSRTGGASFKPDMVILCPVLVPAADTGKLAEILGIETDGRGFLKTRAGRFSAVTTARAGVFVAGCAQAPMDIGASSVQAEAAVGKALSLTEKTREGAAPAAQVAS